MLIRFTLFLFVYFFSISAATTETVPLVGTQATNTQCHCGTASYADAVEKAAPAVVSIQTTKHIAIEQHPLLQDPFFRFRFFGDPDFFNEIPQPEQLQHGLGSGVIINRKGYILTNNHVIKGASNIVVKLPDDRVTEAIIVGTDPQTDLAVLKIELDKLPVINLGVSAKLRVGDVVLAIGNPFGIEKTVTQGIVSATGSISARTTSAHSTENVVSSSILLDNLIQTDAAINPGNSGGALIDAYGNLIGLNMAIISGSGGSHGIGFAIPIDTAKEVMIQLITKGHMSRGWLGAYLSEINDDLRHSLGLKKPGGVYVQGTFNHSPAKKAGILPGDIIVKINGLTVEDSKNAIRLVSSLVPGKQYPLEIFRKGSYLPFSVIIGERPPQRDN